VQTVLICAYLATLVLQFALGTINLRHRRQHGHVVPSEFTATIDAETLGRSSAYHADGERFGLVRMWIAGVVALAFIFGGGLRAYDHWIRQLFASEIQRGIVFFVGLHVATTILDLPLDAYSTFRIEQRHGFNRTSPGLFAADWIKGLLLGTLLVAGISAAGLALYRATPAWYWFYFWGFAVGLAALLMLISPYVIEPLFIKATPLGNEGLADAVRVLGERAGVQVTRVLQVDASRRSAHSNAYFTGIGSVKRVVLFDTLLERLNEAEILAVLGHELGHWRLRHVTQRLMVTAGLALIGLFVAARCLACPSFAAFMGIGGVSMPAQLVLLAFAAQILGFALTPLSAYWSRCHEWQADAFAMGLVGNGHDLAMALSKLARDNLTNLSPHPLYAAFYYSHPPATARVRKLLASEVHATS
jgi:STE24 endopeptidase